MIIEIPNVDTFNIKNILLDYNGTIAESGQILEIDSYLQSLSKNYNVYIVSGDTFGNVKAVMKDHDVTCIITHNAQEKLAFLNRLGPQETIAIGNGSIDAQMLYAAAIGIVVLGQEGCSMKALMNGDILVKSISDAFDMILQPLKLIATLKE